jgi:ATP-dependent helicase Lhr and Lhr-like helicase
MGPFAEPLRQWFCSQLGQPTPVQAEGWPKIKAGHSVLLIAPTGSGKTLAAFLAGLDRLMFESPPTTPGVRLLYVSPLKALAVDVERNLRVPLAGIEQAAKDAGVAAYVPSIAVRSGDTPTVERARFRRHAADILITTPESLYLLLGSDAARHLASVETVIIDEVHSVLGSKRGAHLAISLERLQALRRGRILQRIGLSATVNPIAQASAWLGGFFVDPARGVQPRPVQVVNAARPPRLELQIEMPVQEMPRTALPAEEKSLWPAIHRPLLELVKQHRSTLIFVNNRGLAERLSSDLNQLCGEDLVLAHHGAIARERRAQIEEALKNGRLRGLVATSTLELGIDMGAIDLVVQIEAPPSVASGLQRIGRAGHTVGGVSKGIIYPKFRGDLLAAAATVDEMRRGQVEALHFPRNPLDVLAQQVVAIVSMGEIHKNELLGLVRGAAPLSQLSEASFDSVLDMLSGRYPSDAFAELRPRINWERTSGILSAHKGARHLALINGGTIADRGLYGVFLAGEVGKSSRRVGELDEEMVFESRIGDVFLLGASSWRIEDITPDRVLVTPAPGEPGRMPFWHGDRAGRPLSLGKAVGALARELDESTDEQGRAMLMERGLAPPAAENLVAYLREERAALGQVPSDRQIVVESFLDELGDFRVCVLSPFGSRVHAPWAIAAMQLQNAQLNTDTQAVWFDDGIVFRFPRAKMPALSLLIPDPLELDDLLQTGLASSALFASHFRESAARALLLPRRMPGRRTPLWAQRRRSAELLRAASEYPDFPIVLETMRECLSDVFDVSGLRETLGALARGEIGAQLVQTATPSPFAAALLFNYAGNFMYSGDAPLAERRAQALTVNQSQLRELLGEVELRHLLDPDAIVEVEHEVRRRTWVLSGADDVHDLLATVGELEASELAQWNGPAGASLPREDAEGDSERILGWLAALKQQRRVLEVPLGGKRKYIAAEDARRYQPLVELKLPDDFPAEFLEPVRDPVGDLVARFTRTHGPFRASAVVRTYPLREDAVVEKLRELERQGRVTSGYFLPGGTGIEWCDVEVLRRIKQRSLARLRQQVKPVKAEVYARCLIEWQGAAQPRRGLDILPTVLEQLQGAPLVASALEKEVLPARVEGYHPSELDALILSGEFVWFGLESLGQFDGRIALYPRQEFALLAPTPEPAAGVLAEAVRQQLRHRGASFFEELVAATGAFAPELLEAIWSLVWSGEVTNDSLGPLRSRLLSAQSHSKRRPERFYSRRPRLAGSEGRWSLLERWRSATPASPTERLMRMARTLINRYGVLPSEAFAHEPFASFSEVYPVLKELEQAGKLRRGYFVEGLAATQFAEPGADDRLRVLRETNPPSAALVLAATDPANPYGAILPWPDCATRPQRAALARVVIYDGRLVAYVSRTGHSVQTFLPDDDEAQSTIELMTAQALVHEVDSFAQRSFEIKEINGGRARDASFGQALVAAGFVGTSDGYFYVTRA